MDGRFGDGDLYEYKLSSAKRFMLDWTGLDPFCKWRSE